jgi:phenylpropionate dioxygenase-like ring-hydroxylating dioxygenase large terminal subunit
MPDDQRHAARCPGISTAEILATDARPAPAFLGEGDVATISGAEYSIDAYIDPAFHKREVETVWSRCWQVACREDEVPKPGDFAVYDIADMSALVIRGRDGALRAFVNSCPHRGTRLAEGHGNMARIRCPFHAMTWSADGELK